jgi:hypothetical protein
MNLEGTEDSASRFAAYVGEGRARALALRAADNGARETKRACGLGLPGLAILPVSHGIWVPMNNFTPWRPLHDFLWHRALWDSHRCWP